MIGKARVGARHWLAVAATIFVLFTLALHHEAHAASRVALVVGNGDYSERPLRNPANDAASMQKTLQSLGFEVSLLHNADRKALLAGLRDFEANARQAEVALFFFAGHGAQVGGSNYLIPVNARIQAESDVPDEAIDAASVLRRIEEAKARVGLVILDACRDNPYVAANRSGTRGLARMDAPTGSIIAYATAPGSTASDGDGRNGLYTEQLTRHLREPGLDLREVFDRTAQDVERLSQGKQRPREDVGLRGKIYLNGEPPSASSIPMMATPPKPPEARPLPPASVAPPSKVLSIEFSPGQSVLSTQNSQAIKNYAAQIKHSDLILTIAGFHDDATGQAHAELIKRRVLLVKEALEAAGIPAERINLQRPKLPNGDATGTEKIVSISAGR